MTMLVSPKDISYSIIRSPTDSEKLSWYMFAMKQPQGFAQHINEIARREIIAILNKRQSTAFHPDNKSLLSHSCIQHTKRRLENFEGYLE